MKRQYSLLSRIRQYRNDRKKEYFASFKYKLVKQISSKEIWISCMQKTLMIYTQNLLIKAFKGFKNTVGTKAIKRKYAEGMQIFILKKHFEKWRRNYEMFAQATETTLKGKIPHDALPKIIE